MMTLPWRPRAWIPNVHGFALEARLIDGRVVPARVVRDARGLHRLEGVAFASVTAWRAI
jgi:hypothetical protein